MRAIAIFAPQVFCKTRICSVRFSATGAYGAVCTHTLDMANLHAVMALEGFGDKWSNRMSEVSDLDMRWDGVTFENHLHAAGVSEPKHVSDDYTLIGRFYKNWQVRVCNSQINVIYYTSHAGAAHWNHRPDFDAGQIRYSAKLV